MLTNNTEAEHEGKSPSHFCPPDLILCPGHEASVWLPLLREWLQSSLEINLHLKTLPELHRRMIQKNIVEYGYSSLINTANLFWLTLLSCLPAPIRKYQSIKSIKALSLSSLSASMHGRTWACWCGVWASYLKHRTRRHGKMQPFPILISWSRNMCFLKTNNSKFALAFDKGQHLGERRFNAGH